MSPSITSSTASKLNNSKVTIVTNDYSSGRGLETTQSVPGGSLLVRLDPLISVLDESMLDKACSHCFVISKSLDATVGKELLKCTGCGFLRYCSKVHCPCLSFDSTLDRTNCRYVKRRIGKRIIRGNVKYCN